MTLKAVVVPRSIIMAKVGFDFSAPGGSHVAFKAEAENFATSIYWFYENAGARGPSVPAPLHLLLGSLGFSAACWAASTQNPKSSTGHTSTLMG
jgi:hypothetical protein